MNRINIANPEFEYDGDDPEGFRSGMVRPGPAFGAKINQPVGHGCEAFAAVREDALADVVTLIIGEAHVMRLSRPIDASEPYSVLVHTQSPVLLAEPP